MKKIVCYGDSNTWGYDPRSWFGERYDKIWPEMLSRKAGWDVVNRGENGREIPGKGEAFPPDTDLLIVMLGTNDLLQGKTPETAAAKMGAFVDQLTPESASVLLIAPPPMALGAWVPELRLVDASRKLALCYRELAMKRDIWFADAGEWGIETAFDGVHFTEQGHERFAEKLFECIKKFCIFNNATGG